ncbi:MULTISPECIES: VOC family protein [Caproicibacterium]|jgi:catechol 2,3-dioxygenase-like lactoylglutathione lyase family enzyme|uniref:Glyoxalase n=1 Tax=Caproicibacterium lactatifermentans TaxID=2666138 RepID=A0A859DRN8_9FIRM|nr:VOC family protein [Caproicibacterium lactatifermentans]ARP49708.1 hypothetical protein B6259_01655 [Ruminococcaceae bacterium CPB6]MDD4807660.1 glyoxalase [Oscillospiraceae bacterium]QKN24558.1 glyoxalase [Caproicibacterium lactatifermentans]QKO30426.1 glyoxalase [Caproicibacterium lactatifermentans]
MNFQSTLIVVHDMERSKAFYCRLFNMTVTADFGENVTLSDHLSLQTLNSWRKFVNRSDNEIQFGGCSGELYFETDDMTVFQVRLESLYPDIEYITPPEEQPWGQQVTRFYDPDHHIIEVGEKLETVARRFLAVGFSSADTAKRMQVPEEMVQHIAEEDDAELLFSLMV